MARLRDIPAAWRAVGPLTLVKRVVRESSDDNLAMWAAALAYAWLFAIFPFLIFLMSLLPYLPANTKDSAKHEISRWVYESMPKQAADTVWQNVHFILSRPQGTLLSVGLVLTLWGASGGMNMTISALDRCYDLDAGRPFYKQRPLAILLTMVLAVLILILMLVLPVGTIAIRWIEAQAYPVISWPILLFWKIVRYPMSFLLLFSSLHILYHYGPSIRQDRVYISPGAVFCVAVWVLLGLTFRFYVDRFGKYNETYGAVGGVVILLLFFYLDSLVLLMGAEINSEIDFIVKKVPRGHRDFRRVHRAAASAAGAEQGA